MTKQQMTRVILPVLSKSLLAMGWFCVVNRQSGWYWKNGCVLRVGLSNEETGNMKYGCLERLESCYTPEGVHGKAHGWFIEKDNFVVAVGTFTESMAAALVSEVNVEDNKALAQFFVKIEKVANSTSEELFSERIGYVTEYSVEIHQKFSVCDKKVKDTMMFCIVKDIQTLRRGVYRIVDVSKECVTAIGVMIDDSSEIIVVHKQPTVLPWDIFNKLVTAGLIKCVELVNEERKTPVKRLSRISDLPTASIPENFLNYGLTSGQLYSVSRGIAEFANITPLLNKGISATEELIQALKLPIYGVENLINRTIPADVIRVLIPLISGGLNFGRFIQDVVDADYLTMQLNDFEDEWSNVKEHYELNQRDAILGKIMFSYGKLPENTDDLQAQFIKFRGEQDGLVSVATEILENGVFDGEQWSLPWRAVKNRTDVYKYLSFPDLILPDGSAWNEKLRVLIDEIQYLCFDTVLGFSVLTRLGRIGRDQNSVIAYYSDDKPRWRGVYINGKAYCYGDSMFSDVLCGV